jgi:CobQ-like glutamine amidotransferase family enzyme
VTTIRVAHLYPDYLNIYADRGNIAVFRRRAEWRGHTLEVTGLGMADRIVPGSHDLYYIGGGQDREQFLVAADLASKAEPLIDAVGQGSALLAVCGGYQLLGRRYRGFHGEEMPGVGLLPLETVAGAGRMIGDVLLECDLEPGRRHSLAGFENHAGRTLLDTGAVPLGRVVRGFGNDGESGWEGCRLHRAVGTYLHGPLLPRNPWLADWLLAAALAHRDGGEPPVLEPLTDELESGAQNVAAGRAHARGGHVRAGRDRRGALGVRRWPRPAQPAGS